MTSGIAMKQHPGAHSALRFHRDSFNPLKSHEVHSEVWGVGILGLGRLVQESPRDQRRWPGNQTHLAAFQHTLALPGGPVMEENDT